MAAVAVDFRPADEDDLLSIVALLADDPLGRTREAAGPALDPAYTAAFAAIAADPNQCLVVAVSAGRVVGTLQLSYLPGLSHRGAWRAEIEAVRVASAMRGQGVGARMVAWAVGQARDRGCRIVQLTTNASRLDAHRFYERLGFARSHIGYKMLL